MKRFTMGLIASTAASFLTATRIGAEECCLPISCPPPAPVVECFRPAAVACPVPEMAPQFVLQEQTVMVSRPTVRKQRIQQIEYQTQQRPKVTTIYEQVPEYVNVPTQQTVMVPQTVMQSQTVSGMQAVYRDVTVPVQVQVFEQQQVQRVYEVTKNVAHDVKYRVTTQRVQHIQVPGQAPVVRTLEEPQTRCETRREFVPQTFQETRQETVSVPKLVTQNTVQRVFEYQPVQQTYQVPVVVSVPQVQTGTQQVVQYRTVARQVTTMELVSVPVTVEREIDVPDVELVPMKVQTYVPAR